MDIFIEVHNYKITSIPKNSNTQEISTNSRNQLIGVMKLLRNTLSNEINHSKNSKNIETLLETAKEIQENVSIKEKIVNGLYYIPSKLKDVVYEAVDFTKTYKKSFIALGGISIVGYLLYRKYLKEHVDLFLTLKEMTKEVEKKENGPQKINSITKHFEPTFNHFLSEFITHVGNQIQKHYNLEETYKQVVDKSVVRSKEELESLWIYYKNKVIKSLISSINITRTIFLLSQVLLIILEKFKRNMKYKITKSFYDNILNDIWSIFLKFLEHMTKSFDNKFPDEVLNQSFNLREKYSSSLIKQNFIHLRERVESIVMEYPSKVHNIEELISQGKNSNDWKVKNKLLKSKTEIFCKIGLLEFFLNDLEQKITFYENSTSNLDATQEEDNMNTFLKIKILCEFYDICSSPLLSMILQKGFNHDYAILNDFIDVNFNDAKTTPLEENEEKKLSMPKIISFLNHIKNQIMNDENTIFKINYYKESKYKDDLEKFFNVVLS